MSRRKLIPSQAADGPSFEQALADLEAIVAAMEEDQLPLEDLVANYEKGSKLLARCEAVLHSARQRIERINDRQNADPANDPADGFDTPSSPEFQSPPATDDPAQPDDDIRLF